MYNLGNFSIYKSFDVNKFIFIRQNDSTKKKTIEFINQKKIDFNTKEELINFEIEGILIGDIIYDTYLKETRYPTVDIKDIKLKKFVIDSINTFYFLLDFFKNNNVTGVIIADTSYNLVSRIAASLKIPTYGCNWENVNKIGGKNLFSYGNFIYYKEIFNKFSHNQKKIALQKSKDRIKVRLSGAKRVDDLFYSRNSSWHAKTNEKKVLSNSQKKKILIASHFFVDAPHAYGPNSSIFPDFYEWLNYLYNLSKTTDYEWYIKRHPDSLPKEDKIFTDFIKDKPNLIEIPKFCSHVQIIKEGINCVLTVYGTIAWEYAYYKIPVITASQNNPHIKYDFCAHAKNINEYKEMIINFDKIKLNFNEDNICEFYFMHNMFSRSTWLLDSYKTAFEEINGFNNLSSLKFYDYWIKKNNPNKNEKIFKTLNNFLNSKDVFIQNRSFFSE